MSIAVVSLIRSRPLFGSLSRTHAIISSTTSSSRPQQQFSFWSNAS